MGQSNDLNIIEILDDLGRMIEAAAWKKRMMFRPLPEPLASV